MLGKSFFFIIIIKSFSVTCKHSINQVSKVCESAFFLSTQAQVETRILGPLLVVWWTGLGSPQLNGD